MLILENPQAGLNPSSAQHAARSLNLEERKPLLLFRFDFLSRSRDFTVLLLFSLPLLRGRLGSLSLSFLSLRPVWFEASGDLDLRFSGDLFFWGDFERSLRVLDIFPDDLFPRFLLFAEREFRL